MNFLSIDCHSRARASLASNGQIFQKGAKLVYQDIQVQDFRVDVRANAKWDEIFKSQVYQSRIPLDELLAPSGQAFTDIELRAKLIRSDIPYSAITSLEFIAGYSPVSSAQYILGVSCKSSRAFIIEGLASFSLTVWHEAQ